MESGLLKSLFGVSGFDPAYLVIAVAVLLIAVVVLLVFLLKTIKKTEELDSRIYALCKGADGESLEAEIAKIIEENEYLMAEVSDNKAYIKSIFKRLTHVCQKVSLVKYDALDQMGGLLSFVLVILDENNNGFMINSVHTSTMSYIYSKNVVEGTVEVELGAEEAEALKQAMAVKLPR